MLKYAQVIDKKYEVFEKSIFCVFCTKAYELNVFKYHIDGKKHKKCEIKLQNMTENLNFMQKKCINFFYKKRKENVHISSKYVNKLEAQVKLLLTFLETEFKMTLSLHHIANNERIIRDKKVYNTKIYKDENNNPIPRWLYRHKSLYIEFNCEVCENSFFKGRQEFENHFREERHKKMLSKFNVNEDFQKILRNI